MSGGAAAGGIGSAMAAAAAGAVASAALSAILAPKSKDNDAPAVSPMTAMPDPNSEAISMAKKQSIADQTARRGRASTILTEDAGLSSETLGT